MPNSPIILALFAVTLLTCAFALVKGGQAERIGAVAVLANIVLAFVGDALVPATYTSLMQLSLDALTALAFLGLALSYASLWLGAVMLLYAAQFALHGYYLLVQRPTDPLHVIVNNIDFLLISVALAVGAAAAWRRRLAGELGTATL